MIVKMRKEVFISGTFVNAFRYDWDWTQYSSAVYDGKYVYFPLQEDADTDEYSSNVSDHTYRIHDGVLFVSSRGESYFHKWGECEVVIPPRSTSWLDGLVDDIVVLLTTGELCSFGDVKNRFYLKDGELVNDCNVAAVGVCYRGVE